MHLRDGRYQPGEGEQITETVEQGDYENGRLMIAPYISHLSGGLVITAIILHRIRCQSAGTS